MMVGYYDINGYSGMSYQDLVPGGRAELNTFGDPGAIANDAIASPNHIADYWGDPDPCSATGCDRSQDDCLASFMETGKGSHPDGGTSFTYFSNGAPFYPSDAVKYGLKDQDGMYGVGEYIQFSGYNYATLYSQHIYVSSTSYPMGFTAAQYRSEIDAGRPVMIQVTGHSMVGYGYSYDPIEQQATVCVHDTWSPSSTHTFTWGGFYSGLEQWGVMALTPSNGAPWVKEVVTGDLNGDGKDDLAGVNSIGQVWYTTDLSSWINIPGTVTTIVTGDFDGDGDDDIAGINPAGLASKVFYTTNLINWVTVPGELDIITTGDFNADGRDDLAGVNSIGKTFYTTDLANWKSIP